jgi:cobalt-zinc-cadmium efflux system protein
VHHLHLWQLASETSAVSVHVLLSGAPTLHEAQVLGDGLKDTLSERFGIGHTTIELECHDCEAHDDRPSAAVE